MKTWVEVRTCSNITKKNNSVTPHQASDLHFYMIHEYHKGGQGEIFEQRSMAWTSISRIIIWYYLGIWGTEEHFLSWRQMTCQIHLIPTQSLQPLICTLPMTYTMTEPNKAHYLCFPPETEQCPHMLISDRVGEEALRAAQTTYRSVLIFWYMESKDPGHIHHMLPTAPQPREICTHQRVNTLTHTPQ